MERVLTAVQLPDRPTPADRLVVEVVAASAKDLHLDYATGDLARASAVLCVGCLPPSGSASPLLVRGAEPVPGEVDLAGLQVCTDSAPLMSSSAGYMSGLQHVGSFLPPVARVPAKAGPLDLTGRWFAGSDVVQEPSVLGLLAAATEVTTHAASPVVTVALALGLTVHLEPGPDPSWPVRPEHLSLAGVGSLLPDRRQTLTPTLPRDKVETGAGPRVARLLRQAAYLPF